MSGLKRKDPIPNSTPAKRRRESHDDQSEFRVVNASLVLSVPPVFAANPRAGAQEMLDSMIMRLVLMIVQCVVQLIILADTTPLYRGWYYRTQT